MNHSKISPQWLTESHQKPGDIGLFLHLTPTVIQWVFFFSESGSHVIEACLKLPKQPKMTWKF